MKACNKNDMRALENNEESQNRSSICNRGRHTKWTWEYKIELC